MCNNHSIAVHILEHEGKSSIFSEKGKTRLRRVKNYRNRLNMQNAEKHRKFFTVFEKFTLIHATVTCLKDLNMSCAV